MIIADAILVIVKKIGIFAGTFDPVHEGHVAFALACLADLSLDKVYFLPERQPRRKQGVSNFATRASLIQQRIEDEPSLELLELNERRFNIERTLPQLLQLHPGADLYLLLGSDVALHLKDWKNIDTLLQKVTLAIGMRSNHADEEMHLAMRALAIHTHLTPHYSLHRTTFSHMSSSRLRN